METPISRPMRGFSDRSFIPVVAAAPALLDFRDQPVAVAAARMCRGTGLLSAFFTRAEWGLVRTMSYRNHLTIDSAVDGFVLAAPWVFGFSRNRRAHNTFVIIRLLGLANGFLPSREEEMPGPARRHIEEQVEAAGPAVA